MADLELATMNEIFDELAKRNRVVVLLVEQDSMQDNTVRSSIHWYSGGLNGALGLVVRYQNEMVRVNPLS